MRQIINGVLDGSATFQFGEDFLLQILVTEDDGAPLTLVGPANLVVALYPSPSRNQAASATLTTVIVGSGTAGYCTATIEDNTSLARGNYYVSSTWKSGAGVGAGTTVKIADGFTALTIT